MHLYNCFILVLLMQERDVTQSARASKRIFHVYGCVVTAADIVVPRDSNKNFDKVCIPFCMYLLSFQS